MPDRYDLPYEAGGRTLMAGDVMARVDLLLSKSVVRIPHAAFLIPGAEHDFPFLVLGQEPLFQMAEVRFRAWEGQLGFLERKHRWLEGRYGGLVRPLTVSRQVKGAGQQARVDVAHLRHGPKGAAPAATPSAKRRSTRRPATAAG